MNKEIKEPTDEERAEMKHIQHKALFARCEVFYERLNKYNAEKEGQKKSQVFYIQGFAVIGYSKSKAEKKLRGLLGHLIGSPGTTKEEIDLAMNQLVGDIKAYDTMPKTEI
jgi:hypothetical protein